MLNYMRQYFKIRGVFHALYISETKSVTPNFFFFAFLTQKTYYPDGGKTFKKSIDWKINIFVRTSLIIIITDNVVFSY